MESTLFRTSEWMLLLATLVCLLAAAAAWVVYDKEMLALALWFTGSGAMIVAVLLAPPDPDEGGPDGHPCGPRRQAPE
jgi:hypothetical protein